MDFWDENSQAGWLKAEGRYWDLVKETDLERRMEALCSQEVKNMNTEEFFDFLFYEYFVWKYTAKNRLATTRKQLQKHRDNLPELKAIQKALFSFDLNDSGQGLRTAMRIKGLGPAGASGLLAILFPQYFGTVDQFVVKSLAQFEFFAADPTLQKIKPDSISEEDAVYLIELLKSKAQELNRIHHTDYWTPRRIDKVLWAWGR